MGTSRIIVSVILLLGTFVSGCSDDPAAPNSGTDDTDIQSRVNAASVGDTVLIAPGIYTELHEYTDFIGREILVFCVMKPGVVVRGATGDPADVVIDAGGVGRGFWFFETGDSTGLAAVTVKNALWAISGYDASPWIDNCVLEENGDEENYPVSSGMGMYFDRSNSVVTNCVFRNNVSASGGAATFSIQSNVRLEDCIFINNRSTGSGGGLVLGNDSSGTIVDCSFTGNHAVEQGGGIFSNGNSIVVIGGSISGNSAGTRGGGVFISTPILGGQFEGVVILGNSAPEAAQGYVTQFSGEIRIDCCETIAEEWVGEVIFENEGCE